MSVVLVFVLALVGEVVAQAPRSSWEACTRMEAPVSRIAMLVMLVMPMMPVPMPRSAPMLMQLAWSAPSARLLARAEGEGEGGEGEGDARETLRQWAGSQRGVVAVVARVVAMRAIQETVPWRASIRAPTATCL